MKLEMFLEHLDTLRMKFAILVFFYSEMLRRLVSVGKGRVWHRSLASNKQKQQVSTPVIGVGEELPKVDPLSISTEGEPVRQIDTR